MRLNNRVSPPDHVMRELLQERDQLCEVYWQTRHALPHWAIAPLMAAGLTRDEVEAQSLAEGEDVDEQRLRQIELRVVAIDRELMAAITEPKSGPLGGKVGLAAVIKLAVEQLKQVRSPGHGETFGRAELIGRMLEAAARSLTPEPALRSVAAFAVGTTIQPIN
jgi:hypothetical protein